MLLQLSQELTLIPDKGWEIAGTVMKPLYEYSPLVEAGYKCRRRRSFRRRVFNVVWGRPGA
jgi:hypothetical protein